MAESEEGKLKIQQHPKREDCWLIYPTKADRMGEKQRSLESAIGKSASIPSIQVCLKKEENARRATETATEQ